MTQDFKKQKTIFPEPFYFIAFNVSGVQGSNLSLVKTLFSSSPESLKTFFEKGIKIRNSGWDLDFRQEFKVSLNGIEAENRTKRIQIMSNGMMIIQGALISDFLCWGSGENYGEDEEKRYRIHPLALIEFTYNAVIALEKVLEDIDKPIPKIQCHLGFVGLEKDKHYLVNGEISPRRVRFDAEFLKGEESEASLEFDREKLKLDEASVGAITYQIIEKIYRMFGFLDEDIPYVDSSNGEKKISKLQITNAV